MMVEVMTMISAMVVIMMMMMMMMSVMVVIMVEMMMLKRISTVQEEFVDSSRSVESPAQMIPLPSLESLNCQVLKVLKVLIMIFLE